MDKSEGESCQSEVRGHKLSLAQGTFFKGNAENTLQNVE